MIDNRTTELLREGLTEHGIEWLSGLEGVTFVGDWCFVEYDNGKLAATCEPVLTPEQAIAATLGSGTCEMYRDEYGVWHCSSCEKGADKITGSDGTLESWNDSWPPNFCPNCGAEVVGE